MFYVKKLYIYNVIRQQLKFLKMNYKTNNQEEERTIFSRILGYIYLFSPLAAVIIYFTNL